MGGAHTWPTSTKRHCAHQRARTKPKRAKYVLESTVFLCQAEVLASFAFLAPEWRREATVTCMKVDDINCTFICERLCLSSAPGVEEREGRGRERFDGATHSSGRCR